MLTPAAALVVEGLSYRYPGGREALSAIGFSLAAGGRLAILGANGAGKTTLLLHLNGLLRGDGSIRAGGLSLARDHLVEIRRRVGLVFQDPNDQLFCPTVAEDVAFGPRQLGLDEAVCARRVAAALASVGMAAHAETMPHQLSLGEKKRAALATVLAMEAEILALDEPSGPLDPRGRRELIALLAALPQTLVIATHDLDLARTLCPRALVLAAGRKLAEGETAQLLADATLMEKAGL